MWSSTSRQRVRERSWSRDQGRADDVPTRRCARGGHCRTSEPQPLPAKTNCSTRWQRSDPHRAAVRRHPKGTGWPADRIRGSRDFVMVEDTARQKKQKKAVALVGARRNACGADAKPPDSINGVSTVRAPAPQPTTTGRGARPIDKFLEDAGVTANPSHSDKLTDLRSRCRGRRVAAYFNPELPPGTRVIARGDTYPTAIAGRCEAQRRLRRQRAIKHATTTPNFAEIQAAQTPPRQLARLSLVDDRGQLRTSRPA